MKLTPENRNIFYMVGNHETFGFQKNDSKVGKYARMKIYNLVRSGNILRVFNLIPSPIPSHFAINILFVPTTSALVFALNLRPHRARFYLLAMDPLTAKAISLNSRNRKCA